MGSFLTAWVQSPLQFLVAQIITRSFILSSIITSFVMVSEEFPAERRGWGLGIMGGLGALGFGLGVLLYGAVDYLPFGWRLLYAIGLLPLVFWGQIARGLKETTRFATIQRLAQGHSSWRDALGSIGRLWREHPRRVFAVALIGALSNAGISPTAQFTSQFLQNERGWTPTGFAAFSIAFGVFAIFANPLAGRLSDRYGRRRLTAVVLLFSPWRP